MKRKIPLRVEELETRLVPAAFGFPFPDGAHLTISFVPDHTPIGPAAQSNLFATLGTQNAAAWEQQVLRALQTWAVAADVNFGVVSDSGAAFGTHGALQGDSRFGDIRIGATSLGPDLVATTNPFDPAAGTWSGDVLLNSDDFGPNATTPYDLYSVALHEIGHALGLANNDNPSSVMFSNYIGVRTGLSRADVAAVRDLYGSRDGSADWWRDDDSWFWTADFRNAALDNYRDQLAGKDGWQAAEPLSVDSSIDNRGDANFYFYQTTGSQPGFSVNLETSGRSLLEGRLTVYDLRGHVVGSATATDPLHGNLSVTVQGQPHGLYFFKVEGAAPDVFGIGAYRLKVVPANADALNAFIALQQDFAAGAARDGDNTFATATHLHRTYSETNDRFDYLVSGQLAAAGNVDYYRLRAPRTEEGAAQSMTVTVWGQQTGALSPVVSVFDAQGNPVSATVVAQNSAEMVVRVAGAVSDAVYYVEVGGRPAPGGTTPTTGAYSLGIDFSTRALPAEAVPTDAIDPNAITVSGLTTDPNNPPQTFRGLQLNDATLLHLDISAQDSMASEGSVTIFDQKGNVVFQAILANGQSVSANLFLPAGTYSIGFAGGTQDPSHMLAPLTFQFGVRLVNGPIGPLLTDPDETPPPLTEFEWLPPNAYHLFALLDPFGSANGMPGGS